MAVRATFQATSVFENPAPDELPGYGPLAIQFPVDEESPETIRRETTFFSASVFLFCWLGALPLGGFGQLGQLSEELLQVWERRVAVVLFWAGAVVLLFFIVRFNMRLPQSTKSNRLGLWGLTVLLLLAWLLSVVIEMRAPVLLVAGAAVAVLQHAKSFRKHLVYIASGGFYHPDDREEFRTRGTLPFEAPKGKLGKGFVEAWKLWATYNRYERRHPSIVQSPVGTLRLRALQTWGAAFLTGEVTVSWLLREHSSSIAGFISPEGVAWSAAAALAAFAGILSIIPFGLHRLALFIGCLPILSIATGLRETAYSAERMERFLDCLEFDFDVSS